MIVLTVLVGGLIVLNWLRIAPYLPRSRKPLLPVEDRPPLASRITFTSIDQYVAEGLRGIRIHLMQADRRGRF